MWMKYWVIVIFFSFIICSGIYIANFFIVSSQSQQVEAEVNSKDEVTLTFWRNYGTKAENKAYKDLIATFQKQYPNIKIELVSIPFSDYEMRIRTEIAAGSTPDILSVDSPNLALYANSGVLLSLDKYMRAEGKIEDIPEAILKGLTYEGEIYLAPIAESGLALFYNKKLFKEAGIPFPSENPYDPLTWSQVLEIAKRLTNPSKGIYGIDPAQGFSDGEGPAYFKTPLIWQFGGDILNESGTTATGYLNSSSSIEALQFYQDLYHKYKVASIELPENPFETGHLGMTILGSWTLADYEKNWPDFKLEEDFGIAPLPKGKYQVVPNGGWALGISAKSKYPEEAWKFVKFASSYEGIKKYVEETGDIPARYSVAEELKVLKTYPMNIFVQQSQTFSKNRAITPAYPIVSDEIRKLFESIGISGENVQKAADDAVNRINKGLQIRNDELANPE